MRYKYSKSNFLFLNKPKSEDNLSIKLIGRYILFLSKNTQFEDVIWSFYYWKNLYLVKSWLWASMNLNLSAAAPNFRYKLYIFVHQRDNFNFDIWHLTFWHFLKYSTNILVIGFEHRVWSCKMCRSIVLKWSQFEAIKNSNLSITKIRLMQENSAHSNDQPY